MAQRAPDLVSYAAYLAVEDASDAKHEFHDGVVVAMSGGTPEHSLLAANAIMNLGVALRGKGWRAYESNLRIRIAARRRGLYPDASVICGAVQHDASDPDAATNPVVLVEVLSRSTEAYDRGEKFELYQALPAFLEYVLVASERLRVEVVRRAAGGTWAHEYYGAGDAVPLHSIGVTLQVDDLYDGWSAQLGSG